METPPPSATPGPRFLDRHRAAATVLSLLAIAGAAVFLVSEYWPGAREGISLPTRAWYTTDDGATWFEDAAERVPPFDHDGKPAVRVHMFSCDDGKTHFVGYLQKLPEDVLKKYRDKGVDPATVDDDVLAAEGGWLFKRPGDGDWVSTRNSGDALRAVFAVQCPGGKGDPYEVYPKNPGKGRG